MKAPVKTFCFFIVEAALLLIAVIQVVCWTLDMKRDPSIFNWFMMGMSLLGCIPGFTPRFFWVAINSVSYVVMSIMVTDPRIRVQIFPMCSTIAADQVNTILNVNQDINRYMTSLFLTFFTLLLMAALLLASTTLKQAIKKANEVLPVKVANLKSSAQAKPWW